MGRIKRASEAFQRLVTAMESIAGHLALLTDLAAEAQVEGQGSTDRLEALETSRAAWEADWKADRVLFEAKLTADQAKAKSAYDSARNAEERTRTMKASYETDGRDLASTADVLAAYRELGFVPESDANGGAPGEVPALSASVEVGNSKSPALRAKFRGGQ